MILKIGKFLRKTWCHIWHYTLSASRQVVFLHTFYNNFILLHSHSNYLTDSILCLCYKCYNTTRDKQYSVFFLKPLYDKLKRSKNSQLPYHLNLFLYVLRGYYSVLISKENDCFVSSANTLIYKNIYINYILPLANK